MLRHRSNGVASALAFVAGGHYVAAAVAAIGGALLLAPLIGPALARQDGAAALALTAALGFWIALSAPALILTGLLWHALAEIVRLLASIEASARQ